MIDPHAFLTYLPAALFVLCFIVWLAELEYRNNDNAKLIRKWVKLPIAGLVLAVALLINCTMHGGGKTNTQQVVVNPPGEEQYFDDGGGMLIDGGSQSMSGESAPRLTTNQYAAGFALVSVATNAAPWLTVPSNAVDYARWTRRGAAEETFWLPATNWGFTLGTNAVEGVHVSSSGTLSFGWPKGSPRAALMPDGTNMNFLAPLQGSLGIAPPTGRFWHAPTDSNSVLLTWQDVNAGRDTNSFVTLQAELFWNGDFAYRYFYTNALALTNFVVGAQHRGGGETYAINDTNLLVNGLELHWRAFGMLDPGIDDHDGDGLSTYDEVMIYGTDPRLPDSDFDGLSDSAEIAAGTNPLDPDTDRDGLADSVDPAPLVWNDTGAVIPGSGGLTYGYVILNGLDPATNWTLDSDYDGWPDWKEVLAGTATNDPAFMPVGQDGVESLFNATFTLNANLPCAAVLTVGNHTLVLRQAGSYVLTLKEGATCPVTLRAERPCTVSLSVSLGSQCAVFQNSGGVFTGGATVPGGAQVACGVIAQPGVTIKPDRVCFHAGHSKTVALEVTPAMAGTYYWYWFGGALSGTDGRSADISWDGGAGTVTACFTATGATQTRYAYRDVTRCSRTDGLSTWCGIHGCEHWYCACDNPVVAGHCGFHNRPVSECLAETCTYHNCLRSQCPADWCHEHQCLLRLCVHGFSTGEGSGGGGSDDTIPDTVSVNNDDDNTNGVLDHLESNFSVSDDDLVRIWPFGIYDGTCCPCPEHQKKVQGPVTLESQTANLTVFRDDSESNTLATNGTMTAGQSVYVEGKGASAAVHGDWLVWKWEGGGYTFRQTNAFTVLSVRLFGDITLDGTVDAEDIALHRALSEDYGWGVPVSSNVFRKVRLRTDVGVAGIFKLALSGDPGIRIWVTGNPASTNSPLLVCGQTVTNGVNGVSFLSGEDSDLYVEAVSNGTATLTYAYIGTGDAEGLGSMASLKMTAFDRTVEILNGESVAVGALQIARWENAFSNGYVQASGWTLTNAVFKRSEFISGDTDRFRIRVNDEHRLADEAVTVYVSTECPGDSTYDASQHAVTLQRISPGIFVSTNMMLVSDWNDASFDAVAYGVSPDSTNRLFLSQLSSRVIAAYCDSWGSTNVMRAIVGVNIKTVAVDVAIMRTNGAACVDAQAAFAQAVLAKERLAQANIAVKLGALAYFDAPPDVDLSLWHVVDTTDSHSLSSDARSVVHLALVSVTNESDNICLIFVPSVRSTQNTPVAGHTTASYWYTRSIDSPYTDHCLISVSAIEPFVSAHELCHALDVRTHEAEKCNLMFATASPFTDVDSTKRLKNSQTDRIRSGDHVQ